jgi:hypothetical protein
VSDIDTGVVDSLKVLDPRRPIREATYAPQQERPYSITSSGRHFEVEHPGRLHVDDQLELDRLLDRLGALENATSDLAPHIRKISSVTHQAADLGILA